MKRYLVGLVGVLALVSFVFAETGVGAGEIMITGTLIDNACAGGHMNDLGAFIKTHTKECAIALGCIDSGYSIYSNGTLYKFDKESGVRVGEFLKKAENRLTVVVKAKKVGSELSLISIENQK